MDNTNIIEDVPTKKDKGFTLVELLIVIVILGILATVTVFAVRGITDKGQENACSADRKTLEVAAEAWYALPANVDINNTPANAADDVAKEITVNGNPDAEELVAVGLIREEPETHTVVDGDITAVGDCA